MRSSIAETDVSSVPYLDKADHPLLGQEQRVYILLIAIRF